MSKKSSSNNSPSLTKIAVLEAELSSAQTLIAALRKDNFRLQDALPPPERGVYLFLDVYGNLNYSIQTESSNRYSLKVTPNEAGMAALMRLLFSRQKFLTKAFASDSCPSQNMIDEWLKTNTVKSFNKPDLDKVEF